MNVANTTHLPVGTILLCETEANPQPTFDQFIWSPTDDGGELERGPELEVRREWEGQTVQLSCSVTNTMRDGEEGAEDTADISFEVNPIEGKFSVELSSISYPCVHFLNCFISHESL